MNNEPDYKILSKNLADVLYDLRKMIDDGDNPANRAGAMCAVDAALEQYEDLTVQEMELEREGLLDIVIYNKKVYYRIKYTNPYKYSIWWHRVKEDTTSLLKMVEDDEMAKKLEVAFNNDIENIRNFEKCKKIVEEWKKPQEPEEENDKNFKNSLDLIKQWGEQNKPPSLYQLLWNWWENIFTVDSDLDADASIDMLVSIIDEKFIPPYHDTNDYQWNKCLELMRNKLRNKE